MTESAAIDWLHERREHLERSLEARPNPVSAIARLDTSIAGAAHSVPIRVYGDASSDAAPLIIFLHGGGWVLGDRESHDHICAWLAERTGIRVVAVEYRLAPEHEHPAALDDTLTVARHFLSGANEQSSAPVLRAVDAARIALVGDSAGGHLAALASDLLALETPAFSVRSRVLWYPVVDVEQEAESYLEVSDLHTLTGPRMRQFVETYLPNADLRSDLHANPYRTAHSRAPETFITTAGRDPLRDEGAAYARALETTGVAVEYLHFPEAAHGVVTRALESEDGAAMLDAGVAFLQRTLA
ncbi:alpha/beta hydrolase [Humidisolicoccus flavus]|uniref:alpha/beta hydrolase n=1 Tax=Humidisolicoccus flavus TaxID=3111414 RepID=UPI0032491B7C